jgi:transposase
VDDDTIRTWYQRYEAEGLKGLASFRYEGGACRLSEEQQEKAEGPDHRDAAADDARGGRLDRDRIRH